MEIILPVLLAAAAFAAAWFIRKPQGDGLAQARADELQRQLAAAKAETESERAALRGAIADAASASAAAKAAREALSAAEARHLADLAKVDQRRGEELAALRDSFAKQSQEILRAMTPDVTKEVAARVEPMLTQVKTTLADYRASLQSGMKHQEDALASVRERMDNLSKATETLATQTGDFTAVLKSAAHRGRWGEQTLRRVVEAAGMSPHCDFVEQASAEDRRPDLVVKLPGNRCVIIDSKVPELDAALASQATANRADILRDHAQKLRATIKALAAKDYPSVVGRELGLTAFDKVILFLPAESLLSTALEADNELVIDAGKQGVLLATPATLIGFLGAINLTWQQHQQAAQVQAIADTATELYKRVADFAEHLAGARKNMNNAVEGLNDAFGSFERMVRPKGEELGRLGVKPSKGLPGEMAPIEPMRDLRRKDS
jgi:DNA recombination protein RmuC